MAVPGLYISWLKGVLVWGGITRMKIWKSSVFYKCSTLNCHRQISRSSNLDYEHPRVRQRKWFRTQVTLERSVQVRTVGTSQNGRYKLERSIQVRTVGTSKILLQYNWNGLYYKMLVQVHITKLLSCRCEITGLLIYTHD